MARRTRRQPAAPRGRGRGVTNHCHRGRHPPHCLCLPASAQLVLDVVLPLHAPTTVVLSPTTHLPASPLLTPPPPTLPPARLTFCAPRLRLLPRSFLARLLPFVPPLSLPTRPPSTFCGHPHLHHHVVTLHLPSQTLDPPARRRRSSPRRLPRPPRRRRPPTPPRVVKAVDAPGGLAPVLPPPALGIGWLSVQSGSDRAAASPDEVHDAAGGHATAPPPALALERLRIGDRGGGCCCVGGGAQAPPPCWTAPPSGGRRRPPRPTWQHWYRSRRSRPWPPDLPLVGPAAALLGADGGQHRRPWRLSQ